MVEGSTATDTTAPSGFDAYASDYDAALNQGLRLTGEPKEYYAAGRTRWLADRLTRQALLTSAVQACFDFGCGTGTACACLRETFPMAEYWGYDPSAASIAEASATPLPSGASVRFSAQEEDVPSGHFDLAFTNGVFHHIPPADRAQAAQTVWRSLKPGGWFAFWENNRWNPLVHWIMSRVPFDHDAQMLFPHQARRLLRQAGFDIVGTDYLFVFPAALKPLRVLEPALSPLPLGGQYLVLARKPAA